MTISKRKCEKKKTENRRKSIHFTKNSNRSFRWTQYFRCLAFRNTLYNHTYLCAMLNSIKLHLSAGEWPCIASHRIAYHIRTCRIIVTLLDARDNRFKRYHVIKTAFSCCFCMLRVQNVLFSFHFRMCACMRLVDFFLNFIIMIIVSVSHVRICDWHSMLLVSCLLLYAALAQLQVHRHS